MKLRILALFASVTLLGAVAVASTFNDQEKAPARPADTAKPADAGKEKEKVTVPFFGNEKCPISGEDVKKDKYAILDHQIVYFCCDKCVAKGRADEKGTVAKAYPKETELKNAKCPVMNEDNGDSKDTVTVMGRKIRVCCDDCPSQAKAAPLATLAVALDPKVVDLQNEKCPFSDKPVSPAHIAVAEGKVIRLCCEKCVDAVKKDPAKAIEVASKKPAKKEKHH